MPKNKLGYDFIPTYGDPRLTSIPHIVGSKSILKGDVAWILGDFTTRYHNTIDRLDAKQDDWGHAPRYIAGTKTPSSHGYATAIDVNSSKHPMFYDTMGAKMEAEIRALVRRYKGAIRWGGEWGSIGRLDQMHFEIAVTPARLKQIVAELKAGTDTKPAGSIKPPASKPATSKPAAKAWPHVQLLVDGDRGKVTVTALQELLKGIDLYGGRIDGDFGKLTKIATQQWLTQLGAYKGWIDGDFGELSIKALQKVLKARGFYPGDIDGKWQSMTTKGLQGYLNSQAKHYR